MHTNHDSIAQYIRALKEEQQQAARDIMTTTNATLVIISTEAMLASQHLPTTNDKWEELRKSLQTWGKWKELYKKADKQVMVKRQAAVGRDQFGGAVIWAGAGGYASLVSGGTPVTIDELEGCQNSLQVHQL